MSVMNVHRFYHLLEVDNALCAEAMKLKDRFPDQEDCIDAFIALAERECLPFTVGEFLQVMYERAKTEE